MNSFNFITIIVVIYANKRDDVEIKYIDLRNFLVRYREKGFRIYYSAIDGQERYIVCDIRVLDKTEKTRTHYMSIPLEVEVRSYWKTDVQSSSVSQEEQAGNVF